MEGDAGTSQLNPTSPDTDADEPEESAAVLEVENEPVDVRRQERFGRGWFIGIVAALTVVAVAIGVGGYLALRAQSADKVMAAQDALALDRAKECVAATQAPDIAAMTASQSKIIECSTGDFAVQANLYAGMLVDAYQAAQAAVQVSELRAAVEKHNDDGSVDVLVAVRVKVTNAQSADQEQGYRLRAKMALEDGTYKISSLDQVTS
jgi:Mce-associated membrane protein